MKHTVRFYKPHTYQELLVGSIVAVIIGVGEWVGVITPVRTVLQSIAQPVVQVVAHGQYLVSQPFRYLTTNYQAAQRVSELERELSSSLARLSELEQVKTENDQLRQALGAQDRPEKTVIGSPITSYGLPTISVGSAQGITPGSPVLATNTLIGLAEEVSVRQSTVSLLSSAQVQPVVARTASGAEGLIRGDGKRVLLTEVSHDYSLAPGERVVTAGQSHLPADIFIGTVGERISDQSAPVQTLVVEQLVTFYEVPVVEVLP